MSTEGNRPKTGLDRIRSPSEMGYAESDPRILSIRWKTISQKRRSWPVSGTAKSSLPYHGGESSDASAHLIGAARRRRRWEHRVFPPIYSGDPVKRTDQLIFTSEDLRNILMEWERFWFLDQPSHLTPYRVHGGVI